MATRSSTLRGAKASFAAVLGRGASLIWSAASIAAFPYGFKSYCVKGTYLTAQLATLIKAMPVTENMRYKKAAVPAALQIGLISSPKIIVAYEGRRSWKQTKVWVK